MLKVCAGKGYNRECARLSLPFADLIALAPRPPGLLLWSAFSLVFPPRMDAVAPARVRYASALKFWPQGPSDQVRSFALALLTSSLRSLPL